MSDEITKIGMRPVHPGELIREEILAELNLSVNGQQKYLASDERLFQTFSMEMLLYLLKWRSELRRLSALTWIRCCACRPGTTLITCAKGRMRFRSSVFSRLSTPKLMRRHPTVSGVAAR